MNPTRHLLIALIVVACAQVQQAGASSLTRCPACAVDSLYNPLIRAGIIEKDDRVTEREYAKENNLLLPEVQRQFAPTGEIDCGSSVATAQISYTRGLITTSAHVFTDPKTCKTKAKPTDCTFRTKINGRTFASRVERLVATGFNCPALPAGPDDWAVLRLATAAPKALEPYGLPDPPLVRPEAVVQVAATSADFYRTDAATGKRLYEKHVGNCSIKKVYIRTGLAIYFSTDCDTSNGASGSAVLRPTPSGFQLLGIHRSSDETTEQSQRASQGKSPAPISGPYVEGKWASYNVPLEGTFYDALKEAGDKDAE